MAAGAAVNAWQVATYLSHSNSSNDDDDIDEGDPVCKQTMIKDTLFYPLVLIPAALIVLTFCFTQKRRRLLLNVLKGAPGLIHPMDMLTKSDRISYMCALGATANLIFRCIFDNVRAIDYDGPLVMHTVILLVSMLVFGVAYFPVFGCLTTGSLLGFGTGTLYIWMLLTVELIRMITCDTPSQLYRILLAFRGLPNILCLLYLSVRIPYKFYQDFKYREGIISNLREKKNNKYYTLEDLLKSNIGRHMRTLLTKPEEEEVREGMRAKVVGFLLDHTYRPHPSFRYSARFLSTLFLSLLLLYAVSFQSYTYIYSFRKFLYDDILPILDGSEDIERSARRLVKYTINTVIASVTFAASLGLYGLVRMFTQYRETMFAMNRGKMKHLWKDKTNDYLLLSAMKYSGFQVVYVVWGFLVQLLIFFLICVCIAAVIWAFRDGNTAWFTDAVIKYWPIPMWALIINLSQILMTKFTFMGHKKHLVLDNRRVLFIASYFIFFYNIFLGIFSSLLRIVKSIVIGAILLPRLDSCVLPQDFASMDPGYMTYVGFMKLENDYTHPVMLAFIRLLQILARDRRNKTENDNGGFGDGDGGHTRKALKWSSDKSERSRRHRAIVFRWHTLYTLINNPELRMYRKGYIQKIKLAKELGLEIPKSDTYVSIGDDVIQEAQDLLDAKQAGAIGKIAGAAGNKLDKVKSKIQQRLKEKRGSQESLDDVVESGDGGGSGDRETKETRLGDAAGAADYSDANYDDDVDCVVSRNGYGASRSKSSGKEKYNMGDGSLEKNDRATSGGDISSVFTGNKRRRKKEREGNPNSSTSRGNNNRDRDFESPPFDRERLNYGRELPMPGRNKCAERELTPLDKDRNYGRELPQPGNGGRSRNGERELSTPKNYRNNNIQHEDGGVQYAGRYSKRDDSNGRRQGGDGGDRGRTELDGKWGSIV